MPLRHYLLDDDSLLELDAIALKLSEDELTRTLLRTGFRAFLTKLGVALKPFEISRTFKKPSSVRYKYSIYFYDYITSKRAAHLIKDSSDDEYSSIIMDKIDRLSEKATAASNNNMSMLEQINRIMDMSNNVERIPEFYFDKYIGYRRSSNKNDIVRFCLDITSEDGRIALYENDYSRGNLRWKAIGFGVFIKQTLYLIGHAQNQKEDGSLGLRFIALKQLESTQALSGLLISMDTLEEIIAARIILVRRNKHKFDKYYEDLDEDDFVEKIIEGGREQDRLIYDIMNQLDDAFQGKKAEYLFHLIRNQTFTVLKLTPPEIDAKMIELEEKLEHYAAETGLPLGTIYQMALQRYADEVIDKSPSH